MARNRDIPLLTQVRSTMRLVNMTEKRLDWQHDRMLCIRHHISGMPGGGGLPQGLESAFAMLEEVGEAHEKEIKQYVKDLKKAEKVLNGIKSRTMRAFVEMKYMMDMPDAEIRREFRMTQYSFGQAKKAIEDAESMADVKWPDRFEPAGGNVKKSKID